MNRSAESKNEQTREFFRSLFSRAANAPKQIWALQAAEKLLSGRQKRQGTTSVVP
jgi:hypothetical protein